MSSDTYDRATVGNDPKQGRVRGMIDTLQNLRQNVETVVRQSRFEIGGSGVDQIDAPSELDEFVEKAREVGFIWKGIEIFANDVWEPGYRIKGPDVTKAYLLGESDEIDATPPAETPNGGFLKNSAVYAGEKHQDFYDYGKVCTRQRWLRGTVLTELLKADPEDPESEITGFYFIRPETVSAEVYPNSNILIDPEDTEQPGVELTRRGEAAAYIQFDDQSILGRRGRFDDDTDEIPLSQNDVQKQVLSPGIGDDEASEQGIFGTSVIEPISQDIAEYQQMKRDRSTAIGNKSHGIWLIEHGRDVVDLGDERRLYEWDSESMDDFESMLSNVEPGGYVTHDGSVTPERVEGDVPDIRDVIDHYVEAIISALPTPKYKIGFEDDINRDVTGEQNSDYDRFVSEEREYQERQWTKTLREVCERKGLPTEGLRLRIEPEPDDSPVMSLSVEEIDKLATYADALNSLAGPTGGPQTLVDTETLLTDVAQLPESVNAVEELPDPEDTQNQDAMSEFMDILESSPETDALSDADVEKVTEGVIDALFDPVKHPRDPRTGKFVERPYPVPDDISGLSTSNIIGELAASNDNFTEQVEGIAVDMPGDGDSNVPTEIQQLIDNPDAGSGGSVGDISPIEDFESISEGDEIRVNGKPVEVESTRDGISGKRISGHLIGESKTQGFDFEKSDVSTLGPRPEGDFPRTNFGSGASVEIRGLVNTEYGPKVKIDSPFEAKDAIKGLDFDETHRSWNSQTETWDVDLDSLDTVIDKLKDDFKLQVGNDLLEAAGMGSQIES